MEAVIQECHVFLGNAPESPQMFDLPLIACPNANDSNASHTLCLMTATPVAN